MLQLRMAAICAALIAVPCAPAASQTAEIGDVRRVLIWAYGTPPATARRDLYERSKVVANEVVETVENGALHLRFADGSEFRVGPGSRATLDSFVYNPGTNAGEMVLTLVRGTFRFISGRLNKQGMRLVTPTAAIGLRGTDIFVHVAADGTTSLGVRDGVAVINGAVVNTRQQAIVAPGGAAPVVGSQPAFGNTVDGRGLSDDFDQPNLQGGAGSGSSGAAGGQGNR
jgi:hypothetical protein